MIGRIVRVMNSVSGNRCVNPSIIDGTLLIIHSWGCWSLEMVKAVDKSTFLLAGSSTANTNHFNSWNCFLAPTLKERSPRGVSECSQSSSSKKNSSKILLFTYLFWRHFTSCPRGFCSSEPALRYFSRLHPQWCSWVHWGFRVFQHQTSHPELIESQITFQQQ